MPEHAVEPTSFAAAIGAALQDVAAVRALFLAGSHGQGTADAFKIGRAHV